MKSITTRAVSVVLLLASFLVLFTVLNYEPAQAQEGVTTLFDQVLEFPACTESGENACSDGVVRRERTIEAFAPGSGYVGVFFRDLGNPPSGFQGGFDFGQVVFEAVSGDETVIGNAVQLFERGTIRFSFDQPYLSDRRLETRYEIVIYYLPHSSDERRLFLTRLQENPTEFFQFKDREKRNIAELCDVLVGVERLPEACGGTVSQSSQAEDPEDGDFSTDASQDLPELDFSGVPSRAPEVRLRTQERQVFVGEPVTLEVEEVYDPDGKCGFYDFHWTKTDRLNVRNVEVDPRLGDLFFVPLNEGVFSVKLRAQEACKELGTLSSERVTLRLIVNDKANLFTDINEAPQYANALYDLYHLGVIRGYADGTVRPNAPVNRAEFLKMLFVTLQYRIPKTVFSPRYADVPVTEWFSEYVHQADRLGVIKGYPDGKFHPEWPVNLAEALKMAMHFTTLEITDDTVYSFPDVQNTDWYSRYIKTAYREGILDDISPGRRVYPGQFLTRGKAALIIVRTLLFPVNRINTTNTDVLRRPDEFEDFSSFWY